MKDDQEIAELLGPVTKQQIEAAIEAINHYGFDISAPWQCDQDDREFEMFCGRPIAGRSLKNITPLTSWMTANCPTSRLCSMRSMHRRS